MLQAEVLQAKGQVLQGPLQARPLLQAEAKLLRCSPRMRLCC
jgi:hypothetical protein